MCGIVGVLTSEKYKGSVTRRKVFTQSLYTDALRGFDSTGLLLTGDTAGENTLHYKRALPAADFLSTRRAGKLLSDMEDFSFVIGHNRYATKGGITDETAHPFEFEKVIGVHNGTLKSTHGMSGHSDHTVDSEVLYHAFSKDGHEVVIPDLDGAFALAWYDKVTKNFHLIRNEDRPLFIAEVKGENTIYLASEKEMLIWILTRNGVSVDIIKDIGVGKLLTFNKDNVKGYEESPIELKKPKVPLFIHGNHYSGRDYSGESTRKFPSLLEESGFIVGESVDFKFERFRPYPKSTESRGTVVGSMQGFPNIEIVVYNQASEHFEGEVGNECQGTVISAHKQGNKVIIVLDKEVLFYSETAPVILAGPNGKEVTLEKWNRLTRKGCCYCTGNIEEKDDKLTGWTMDQQPICKSCIESEYAQQTIQ